MDALKKINWKQPKYMIPIIIYVPLLFVGYFVIDLFHTEKAEIPDGLATTEYLNPDLPDAKMKGDGIGSKYESMLKSYGKIDDYSALGNIERNEEDTREEYESKYSDDEREQIEAQEAAKLAEMQRQLQESAQKGQEIAQGESLSEEDRIARSKQREQEAMDELNRAIAQARLQAQQSMMSVPADSTSEQKEGKVEASDKKKDDDEPQEVVKKVKVNSDYFNTLCDNDKEPNLIKAIIDENIKAVDGSRVRLRLLDDIEINDIVVHKGSYLYATMSGFGSQRVKGNVQSIMVDDEIIKVSLALYDTDGLEGLYVPSSQFRETTKDVGSGALSNTSTLTNSSTTSGNNLATWGAQAITNAVQKTSNAISKAIKKNNAKLKYGTFVYLINSRSNKKDK
ncbi:MAG: conjugative transposon protein TraM [Prevotellaceae bacterium]|nr:conjugative transposon protein TraM [Prevotellaceae bacterium]MDY3846995.1 conjugative transposon protein TraM [Prevotella sp.]MDY4539439.1 conjugative transposon protein TraM [Prevotella sp.]MDY4852822.1 conjugative transposon protein TraM [Prevotella sp.]